MITCYNKIKYEKIYHKNLKISYCLYKIVCFLSDISIQLICIPNQCIYTIKLIIGAKRN